MEVMVVSSEAVPYVQTGGLGDVVGAICEQLAHRGHSVHLVIPFYKAVRKNQSKMDLTVTLEMLEVQMGNTSIFCRVWETSKISNLKVYFIEYNAFYNRDNLYDNGYEEYWDNGERFAFFSKAALDLAVSLKLNLDIVHVNDWQTALIPYYLKTWNWGSSQFDKTASLLTLHNMGYQGRFHPELSSFIGLNWMQMRSDEFEDFGQVNFLKGGLFYSDVITTVSPTYAEEILSEPGGSGLSQFLYRRREDIIGILNGIDPNIWNPETDRFIPKNYSVEDLSGKEICKENLQKRFSRS